MIYDNLEARIGDDPDWRKNEPCTRRFEIVKRGVTVENCVSAGRYVFIVAPEAKNSILSLCEVEVIPRGPLKMVDWTVTIGRPFNVLVTGVALDIADRIRVIDPGMSCGAPETDTMHPRVLPRTAPWGAPVRSEVEQQIWEDIVVTRAGFYKVCWCSGMASTYDGREGCSRGDDFTHIAGYLVAAGEIRTLLGTGRVAQPLLEQPDSGNDTGVFETRLLETTGLALSDDGVFLWFTEPHRVRRIHLGEGLVRTVVGSYTPLECGMTGVTCGDGGLGLQAGLYRPKGLAVCLGGLLIADSGNHRIRRLDLETGIVTTIAGAGDPGYSGDNGDPLQAQLNSPSSVACDPSRGFWIADTGNNAIRIVVQASVGGSWSNTGTDVQTRILTGAGGVGDHGTAMGGQWSNTAPVIHPQQICVATDENGQPNSIAYSEMGNHRSWYVPLVGNGISGPVQSVAGTGNAAYWIGDTGNGELTINLDSAEGIAADGSTLFIADTRNHRVIMMPILQYRSVGCWTERRVNEDNYLIPSLEGDVTSALPRPRLACVEPTPTTNWEDLPTRNNALQACAHAALKRGFEMFALRCNGVCAAAEDTYRWYRDLGPSGDCNDGLGGWAANNVYRLIPGHSRDVLGKVPGGGVEAGCRPHSHSERSLDVLM